MPYHTHRMPSVFQSHFSLVPAVHHSRSAFKCDFSAKTTFAAGYVIPFFWNEVNPGDTFTVSLSAMVRFATLLFPLMDNINFYTHYIFVPNRILWANWVKFMGEQDNPGDSIAYTVPTMTSTVSTGYAQLSLFDYFGLPTKIAGYNHITLPLRAYNAAVKYWFRDENLVNSPVIRTTDSGDLAADFVLWQSNKIRDYFTSALPFVQKGSAVNLPLGGTAPVVGIGATAQAYAGGPSNVYETGGSGTVSYAHNENAAGSGSNTFLIKGSAATGAYPQIFADLSATTAATINDLRTSFQLQRFLERDARGGSRYPELVFSHFGVQNPDMRVQWPEYLQGHRERMNVSVIAQTAPAAGGSTPLGNLSGMGTAVIHDHGFTKSFTEHGIVLGLLIARADLTYHQGLNRKWSRSTRYDYPFPVFAHLGEQPVLNQEIYTQGTAGGSADAGVFGYQERYAENRYSPNMITGLFRPNATGTLDAWHLAENFGGLPTLSSTFIVDSPPTTRVKATTTDPDFIMDYHVKQTIVSVLPTYSIPGYIDHF